MATAFRSAPCPARILPRAFFHPRHDQGPLRALQRSRSGLRLQHGAPATEVRHGEEAGAAAAAHAGREAARFGVIYYGSTAPAMYEALDVLGAKGIHINALRVRGFRSRTKGLVASHPWVFVVEQNRDAQLKTLLVNCGPGYSARRVPAVRAQHGRSVPRPGGRRGALPRRGPPRRGRRAAPALGGRNCGL